MKCKEALQRLVEIIVKMSKRVDLSGYNHRIDELFGKGESHMNRIVVKSRVGSDGVLKLTLPLESRDADQEVQITVEPILSTEGVATSHSGNCGKVAR